MSLHEMRLIGTTAADGSATITGEQAVFGLLVAVQWIDGDLADGVDAVLSAIRHDAGATLLTLTNANDDALYYPRAVVHSETGAALTGTSGGDRTMPLICGVPQLAITNGGNANTGGCIIVWKEGV